MARSMVIGVLAAVAAVAMATTGASAQQGPLVVVPPVVGTERPLEAASPDGAVYIPGVGFRYVAPGGPRVYGYYREYPPRVRGYRAYRRGCYDRDWWLFDRCDRRW